MAADVAVSLDGERGAVDGAFEPAQHLPGDDRHAEPRGRFAAGRAVKLDRLARDARGLEPLDLPYSFMIQAITWASVPYQGRGCLLRPDHVMDFLDELAGEALTHRARACRDRS